MIIQSEETKLISNSGLSTRATIHATATAYKIFFSGIYEHKIAAIVRELSCNAWDSHVEAGKKEVPFTVVLPNHLHPYFEIEDYGVGLDDEGVRGVFIDMFDSTKEKSNLVIGCMGLGSKTPYSYTDVFSVIARKDGIERTYTACIGEDGAPNVTLMHTSVTEECNGLKVSVPVRNPDFYQFKWEAEWVLSFFATLPNVKGDFTPKFTDIAAQLEQKGWAKSVQVSIYSGLYSGYRGSIYAVMGGVCYKLNYYDLSDKFKDKGFGNIFSEWASFIHFDIGELEVAASRETLSMTEYTKKNLESKIDSLLDRIVKEEQEEVDSQDNFISALKYVNKHHGLVHWTLKAFSYKGVSLQGYWDSHKRLFKRYSPVLFTDDSRVKRKHDPSIGEFVFSSITDILFSPVGMKNSGMIKSAKEIVKEGTGDVLVLHNTSERSVQKVIKILGLSDITIHNFKTIKDAQPKVVRAKKGSSGVKAKKRSGSEFSASFFTTYKHNYQLVDVSDGDVYLYTDTSDGTIRCPGMYLDSSSSLQTILKEVFSTDEYVKILVKNSVNAKKIENNNIRKVGDVLVEWIESNAEKIVRTYNYSIVKKGVVSKSLLLDELIKRGVDLEELEEYANFIKQYDGEKLESVPEDMLTNFIYYLKNKGIVDDHQVASTHSTNFGGKASECFISLCQRFPILPHVEYSIYPSNVKDIANYVEGQMLLESLTLDKQQGILKAA